jgi:hypothetical protein
MERDRHSIADRLLHGAQAAVKRRMLLLLVCAAALPGTLAAQSQCISNNAPCSTTAGALQVIINIPTTFQLVLSSTVTTLTTPTPAIYDAGFATNTGPGATIRSNAPWALSINALTATWTGVDTQIEPARTDKPASDLSWATATAGIYTNVSLTPVQITTGGATAGTVISLFYRTNYAWTVDTPGNYSLQIVFTIAAP